MIQIFNDIVTFFVAIGSSLWWFFTNLEIYIIWLIVTYVIIVVALILWLRYSRKTFNTINTLFKVSMDDIYYQVSLLLYNNKDNIYNFKENIPLLLQYKTEEMNKRNKANYYNNYTKLMDEIEYIWNLTENKVQYDRESLDTQHSLVQNLSHTILYLKNSISVLTLWIAKFFL